MRPRPLLAIAASVAVLSACDDLAIAAAAQRAPSEPNASSRPPELDAFEQRVRAYLLENPEVIMEALGVLQERQRAAEAENLRQAIGAHRAELLNDPASPVGGNPAGDVTVVEFFDYNCGYCKKALADVQTLMKSDPKLRVVLKDFPVLGPDSVEASRVALAVKNQLQSPKLFDYHVKVMETRGRVNGERALAVAKEMGADLARLQRDMEAAEVKTALATNVELGDKLGLTGTPAFVIGEEVISGAVGLEPLRKIVAATRQCGKAVC